jgi:toxin YoeB
MKRVMIVLPECLEDLIHWATEHHKTGARVLRMMEETPRDPFGGIGKPQPLKQLGPNIWSKRVTEVDRLVYRVSDTSIDFLQARYHY